MVTLGTLLGHQAMPSSAKAVRNRAPTSRARPYQRWPDSRQAELIKPDTDPGTSSRAILSSKAQHSTHHDHIPKVRPTKQNCKFERRLAFRSNQIHTYIYIYIYTYRKMITSYKQHNLQKPLKSPPTWRPHMKSLPTPQAYT